MNLVTREKTTDPHMTNAFCCPGRLWPGMPDISWLKLPQLPQRLVEDTRNQLLDLKKELFPEMNLWQKT